MVVSMEEHQGTIEEWTLSLENHSTNHRRTKKQIQVHIHRLLFSLKEYVYIARHVTQYVLEILIRILIQCCLEREV